MSELGESLGMSPGNMMVLVDGLEKQGLVRRVSHEQDRRIMLVERPPGRQAGCEQEIGPSHLAAAALFDDLTCEERAELLRLLEKVADSLHERRIQVHLAIKVDPPCDTCKSALRRGPSSPTARRAAGAEG